MQSSRLPLLPQYQHWVDQWVLTQPEAEQLQFLMESLMDGQEVEAPQEMELALQKLGNTPLKTGIDVKFNNQEKK